jgi:hypothetical protein
MTTIKRERIEYSIMRLSKLSPYFLFGDWLLYLAIQILPLSSGNAARPLWRGSLCRKPSGHPAVSVACALQHNTSILIMHAPLS